MTVLDYLIIYVLGAILVALFFIAQLRFFNKDAGWPMNKEQIKYLILMCALWPITIPALLAGTSSSHR